MSYKKTHKIAESPIATGAPFQKGLALLSSGDEIRSIPGLGWNLLREDLSLPAAVLYRDKLTNNISWMKQFIAAYGVKLAPHGKTTMAPALFSLQLDSGAWGITLATPHQTAIAYQHSVRRVLMANQLIGKQNRNIISRLLEDPEFEYFCLVDSAEIVNQLGAFFREKGQRLQVLIELGVEGGRTGARNANSLDEILLALATWRDSIALCGIEIYEGILNDELEIRTFLNRAMEVARSLASRNLFDRNPVILSGAGSVWYDVVAEALAHAEVGTPVEVVLRPGCYLTSDAGIYKAAQERIMLRNPVARELKSSLQQALQLWAYVQSIPESGRAILGLGRRDAAFDAGLPVPVLHYRPGQSAPVSVPKEWKLSKIMDQHSYMDINQSDDIRVGDMIGLAISHPCTTFDKWRYIAMLDPDYSVVDVIETFF
jgi:D-serine dehydratase